MLWGGMSGSETALCLMGVVEPTERSRSFTKLTTVGGHMNILEILKRQLESYEKALIPIFEERDRLNEKILELVNERDKIKNKISNHLLKAIPKTPSKITKEQWEWLLHTDGEEGEVKYKAKSEILLKLGFSHFGYHQETKQPSLSIGVLDKVKAGFKILSPHLKPVTVIDRTKEIGLRFEVGGIQEGTISVLYVHKKGDAILYINGYQTQKFKNFDAFVDWYKKTGGNNE